MGKDLAHLFHDADARADHYGELLHYVDMLRRGEEVPKHLRSQIMLRYTEPTTPPTVKKAVREAIRKIEPSNDPSGDEIPIFEEQDAGPAIKII